MRKHMIDGTTPERRARMEEFITAMQRRSVRVGCRGVGGLGCEPASSGSYTYAVKTNMGDKAAYYKGGNPNAGYWNYATQSDTAPTAVTAGTTGIGSAGATGNFANYNAVADWNGVDGG